MSSAPSTTTSSYSSAASSNHRGGRGHHSHRPRRGSGPQRGGRGGRGGGAAGAVSEKARQSVLELSRFLDQRIKVKFAGGRQVEGVLKGWDPLVSLVLDEAQETFLGAFFQHNDPESGFQLTDRVRNVGLVVCKGTAVMTLCPADGFEEIENPFLQQQQQQQQQQQLAESSLIS